MTRQLSIFSSFNFTFNIQKVIEHKQENKSN